MIAVNLSGTFYCCQAAARRMRESGGGVIVNISSVGGLIGLARRPAYTAAKHGVVGLTKSLARDLGPAGIRVNAICPGLIRTPLTEQYFAEDAFEEGLRTVVPQGRVGRRRRRRRRRALPRERPVRVRERHRARRSTAAGSRRRASRRAKRPSPPSWPRTRRPTTEGLRRSESAAPVETVDPPARPRPAHGRCRPDGRSSRCRSTSPGRWNGSRTTSRMTHSGRRRREVLGVGS